MSSSSETWAPCPAVDLCVPEELAPARVPLLSVILLDTETTGLAEWDRIVEIACAEVALDGTVLREAAQLVHPEREIPPEVTRIHGITDADVAGAGSLKAVLPRVLEWLARSPGAPILAHNAPFDLGMIRQDARRVGVTLPGRTPVYCTRELAQHVLPGRARAGGYRLQALATHYGVRVDTAHRAMADVRTLGAVARELLAGVDDLRTAIRPVGHL